ncbi:MAG: WbqC family protein [Flavobacteriales bacterium]|nr:WbqC family protein [Flavobacteriales bacterium]
MEVFPAVCFPSLGYLRALASAEEAIIDIGEFYVKQSYRNRFDILGPNGKLSVTARVEGSARKGESVKDAKLVNDEWRRLAKKGIQAAYGKSAYFIHYYDDIESLINHAVYLSDLSVGSIQFLLEQWGRAIPAISETYVETQITKDHRTRRAFIEDDIKQPYTQVFSDRFEFVADLSGIDVLMNLGPAGAEFL